MATKKLPAFFVVGASQLVSLVTAALVIVIERPALDNLGFVPWAVASGGLMTLGLVSFYSAFALGTMSIIAPISGLGVLIPLAWGIMIEGFPTDIQLLAILLSVGGALLAGGAEMRSGAGIRSLVYACVAAFGFGGSMLALSEASSKNSMMSVLVMKMAICGVIVATGRVWVNHRVPKSSSDLGLITLVGLLDIGAIFCLSLAFRNGPIAIVAVVAALYPVATLLLARFILLERLLLTQRIGVTLAMSGLILLSVTA